MGLHATLQLAFNGEETPEQIKFDRWLEFCFKEEPHQSVLIRIVGETEGAALNQQYRHKSGPTNVLSFPFKAPPGIPNDHLGDLVICAPLVSREAQEQKKPTDHHWAPLLIHGILHLQGFDHIDSQEAQQMESLETKLLMWLGIPDPYNFG
jgi:probable rRNA maturation factor